MEVESVEKVDGIAPVVCSIMAGARSAPTEVVGDIGGYMDCLEEILSKLQSAEGKRLHGWAGGHFDPELFDQRAAKAAIKRMLWNHWGGR